MRHSKRSSVDPELPSVSKQKVIEVYRQAVLAGVPLEIVHQKISGVLERVGTTEKMEKTTDSQQEMQAKKQVPLSKRLFITFTPIVCVFFGLFLIGNAVVPIASYYLFTAPSLDAGNLVAPLPQDQVLDAMPQIIVQAQVTNDEKGNVLGDQSTQDSQLADDPIILDTELDYTNLSNWFPNLTLPQLDEQHMKEYILDIPTVDISHATVKLGGSNLDKSLIQYPGTALPGQPGSPVIFGHSILRQFYNPSEKNPRRYMSIFSKIMTLQSGDKIFITHENVKYTYVVKKRVVVKPEDTSILEQQYDVKQLKLITCVPEGTTQDRGVVIAELVKTE
jgi:LPXTG-site transpeptidase (sortase) family protein